MTYEIEHDPDEGCAMCPFFVSFDDGYLIECAMGGEFKDGERSDPTYPEVCPLREYGAITVRLRRAK